MSPTTRPEACLAHLLAAVRSHLQQMRPEEQIAFALLELHGREVTEAAHMLGVAPTILRRRMLRARGKLLFVARRDPMIAHYLALADTLRSLACG